MMETKGLSGSYMREESRLLAMAECHMGFVDPAMRQAIREYLEKEGWSKC